VNKYSKSDLGEKGDTVGIDDFSADTGAADNNVANYSASKHAHLDNLEEHFSNKQLDEKEINNTTLISDL
jgi:hypothetical protein